MIEKRKPFRLIYPIVFGLIGACIAPSAQSQSQSQPQPSLKPCRVVGIDTQVLCGSVDRPLDESKPQGKRITVQFVVLPAVARNKLPDPVVLFAGGPGQSGIKLAGVAQGLLSRLRNRRDVVLFDQRGVGQSMGLECKSDSREPLADGMDLAQLPKRMQDCKTKLKAKHGITEEHFTHFTTAQASRDLEAVRVQLGASQLNLFGASYGTRAALDYMRQFPAQVRRAVIDGVAPPDMVLPLSFATDTQAALDAVFAACEADKLCNQRYPKLADALKAALDRLPMTADIRHPITLQTERVTLRPELLVNNLRSPLYGPALAQALPFAITQAAKGDYTPWMGLANAVGSSGGEMAWGMHFSVVCAEDFPRMPANPAPVAGVFGGSSNMYTQVCSNWPQAAVPPEFYVTKPVNFPVLVLSGGADPVTPPRHGERTAKALGTQARHVVAPNVGHGVVAAGCGRDVMFQFFNAKTAELAARVDASCLVNIPRPPAFTAPAASVASVTAEGSK